jgi:hypothetical protein
VTKLERARIYRARGWCPIPVKGKNPRHLGTGWQLIRLSDADLERYFTTNGHESKYNIGNTLGDASGGLVDADLDDPLAQVLAESLMDRTDAVFGRANKPRSHRLYVCSMPVPNTIEFPDPVGDGNLAELRGSNAQTVFPGSYHVDTGELIEWDEDGDPAPGDWDVLREQLARVCAAVLLVPRWTKGNRHKLTLALAGALLRRGWDTAEIVEYVTAIAQAAPPLADNDFSKIARDVKDTAARRQTKHITGVPTLASIVQDERAMAKIAEWLGLGGEKDRAGSRLDGHDDADEHGKTTGRDGESGQEQVSWPQIDDAALHGLAGDIVRAIEPHTEADPAVLLGNVLVSSGSAAGREAYAVAEGKRHGTNIDVVVVGDTSKGRKGSSRSRIEQLFEMADVAWVDQHIVSGLSSGEGLIYAVRDPGDRRNKEGELVDAGVVDKQLLVVEEEFCTVLKVMAREGNTLSAIIRQAWDSGNLRVLNKNSPIKATGAHISVIGHATRPELRRDLTDTEAANGFGNRFLWLCSRRSKCLPEGGGTPEWGDLDRRLREALAFARTLTQPVVRDDDARAIWAEVYPSLSEGRPGLVGALTSRAEAQVLRLSVIYAVMDKSLVVRPEHLLAALAFWDYAEESARYIFGNASGNPVADRILSALKDAGSAGKTLTEISGLFSRHTKATQIHAALEELKSAGLAGHKTVETDGRPSVVYYAL